MIGFSILGFILIFASAFFFMGKQNAEGLQWMFGLLSVGAVLMVFPMVSLTGDVQEIIGDLLFPLSYLFLIPAISAYKAYKSFGNDASLSQEEKKQKEHAWNRICMFTGFFILGVLAGILIFASVMAV